MTTHEPTVEHIAAELLRLSPDYAATPLLDLPGLAAHLRVAQVLAKDEGRRMLGSFKSLGGTYAGLGALARDAGTDIAGLLDSARSRKSLPALVCASDGNHGLAVAAAARLAGGRSRIFLHAGVPPVRVRRIEAQGAEVVRVEGTYDDAVDAASASAKAGAGILVADTSADDPADPVVMDVMAGYSVIASEVRRQVEAAHQERPTHLFIQAGVGGLAAAMAKGLEGWMARPAVVVVVEPERAACVAAALEKGRVVRVPGDLVTLAEMLSCGEASAPAIHVLHESGARAMSVSEAALAEAPLLLSRYDGPLTTPTGAAGLAGLNTVQASQGSAPEFALDETSRVLIVVTEADVEEDVSQ